MENNEAIKWPRNFKAGLTFGIGLIAIEGSFVSLQITDVLSATFSLNIMGGLFGLMGAWRIAEPILLMHELRNPESSHLFTNRRDKP